ncbi:MAG: hypothetical protein COV08_01285 [Candidatus Vogelbacteria bacterium CG10_big_fil_rev_8_21_14_0_10_49_38]|uniref:Uncharacterized protein n=1 Tax=Candidatus Vogelbacteria bacterium CG10_big_fil_rev_8_21_14_0_10_49_38 TaxID=1975043 RepID=A0A2H0RHW2_9BACT|nr:MAG: hypothetical protein BK006_01305 [bacterium CG10_49_38]PIR46142.1 MAG: hypothetical protein COV08_01285 [Candidatus Vogelbacteria bacterium CG10_big_fil_rev_8_21_14_0_10_49_38]
MKAVMLTENGIEFQDVELGVLSQDWVRVKVAKAGLCGSDVAKISDSSLPAWHTKILGHEFCGRIVELAGRTEWLNIEDVVAVTPLLPCRVCEACKLGQENLCVQGQAIGRTIQGAFAEFVDVPLANIVRVSAQHSLEPYVLADPLSVCIHAYTLAGFAESQKRCLVVGDGTIGCLLAWLLRKRGHETSMSGIHEESLKFTERFGVYAARSPLQTRNFDVVFEAVGRSQRYSLDTCLQAVKWGGVVVALGVFAHGYEYPFVARDLFIGEVRVIGVNAYLRGDFEEAVQMIEANCNELDAFISHRFPLVQFDEALAAARSKRRFTMKIVLETEGLPS